MAEEVGQNSEYSDIHTLSFENVCVKGCQVLPSRSF